MSELDTVGLSPRLPVSTSPRLVVAAVMLVCSLACLAGEVVTPASSPVARGRALYQQRQYAEALGEFAKALAADPSDRDARLLAGQAAYWLRQPAKALEYWNPLLDDTPRNSTAEWDLERQRVLAFYALNETNAANAVVTRLYELRREAKLPAALEAKGFVREHLFFKRFARCIILSTRDGETIPSPRDYDYYRVTCWEVFDERQEVQELWSFSAARADDKEDNVLRRLTVEAAALPGGGNGFELAENLPAVRRVYARFVTRPEYEDVRALVGQVFVGTLKPIEEKPLLQAAVPDARDALDPRAAALAPNPQVARTLTVILRLREVPMEVTRLARLALTDPELAERDTRELARQWPYARKDADTLVDLLATDKPENVRAVFELLPKLGPRQPYLDFALLTAVNTRGKDQPAAFIAELLHSPDFTVRQTAAVMLARQGNRPALEQLFKEIETADATGCALLQIALQELLGDVLPAPPRDNQDSAKTLPVWKEQAAAWWREHGAQLQPVSQPKAGEAYWK